MFTHHQFINNECSQSEYYSQFVNDNIKKLIISRIGIKRIIESSEPNFTDISLSTWDTISELLYFILSNEKIKSHGDYYSLGFSKCIAKEAAYQLKYQYTS